jgi:hypothetical protein
MITGSQRDFSSHPAFAGLILAGYRCVVGDPADELGLEGVGDHSRRTVAGFDLNRSENLFGSLKLGSEMRAQGIWVLRHCDGVELELPLFLKAEDASTIGEGEHKRPYKVAIASLKESWTQLAPSSPFAYSAQRHNIDSIFYMPPDESGTIGTATKLLKDEKKLTRYFESAHYIQDVLLDRLDPVSRERYEFLRFPDSIASVPFQPLPFEERQLDLIRDYRAPKFTTEKPKSTTHRPK